MKKQTIALIILSILFLFLLGYISFDKYSEFKQKEQVNIFQQGAQYGYEQAVVTLIQQSKTCQPVPLYFGNDSINIIAIECLK